MKSTIILVISILTCQFLIAQKGTISYKETMKIEINFEGMDDKMKEMIPQSQSLEKELIFDENQSVYQTKKGEELEDVNMSSDDGSVQITIMMEDEVDNILHKNFDSNQIKHQKGIMGQAFLVSDELPNFQWKLSDEKIKYLGYECQKAVLQDDEQEVTAWFTTEIKSKIGPDVFHGLPGAILMLSIDEGKIEIKATAIQLGDFPSDGIKEPKKGKKLTEKEFEETRIAKEEEMKQMYQSRAQSRN